MASDLQTLRQQLREQFPDAHRSKIPPPALAARPGLPAFPRGALSELSPATPTASLSLLLAQLLQDRGGAFQAPSPSPQSAPADATPNSQSPIPDSSPLGLIDAADSFDPASYGPAACQHLLWIRCQNAPQSLRCTDLLLRDGNLPLLLLDLQLTPLRDLRSRDFPPSSWYRLRNLAEQSGTALLVFTPQPILPCAALQLTLTNSFSLHDLERNREELEVASSQPQAPAEAATS